jgi:hypothetical protein
MGRNERDNKKGKENKKINWKKRKNIWKIGDGD